MSLYAIILLVSVAVPLLLSFERKVQFYKQWKHLFPSILIVAALFISIDVLFTSIGVWGFNPKYHSSVKFFNLPIEEWLFFILIPYASIFIHEVLIACYPKYSLSTKQANLLSLGFIFILGIAVVINFNKYYTSYIYINAILCLLFSLFDKSRLINRFYTSFIVILVPFIIVNGLLTGTFIVDEAVWYNSDHILNIRLLTIPIEDFAYAFCMLYPTVVISHYIKKTLSREHINADS